MELRGPTSWCPPYLGPWGVQGWPMRVSGQGFLQPSHFVFQRALAKLERFEFYERAKKAFAVVATG